MKRLAVLILLFASPVVAQEYATGLKIPGNIQALHAQSWLKHGGRLKSMPSVTASSYDCRALGWVVPIKDQGNCGSCWDFAGVGAFESSLLKGGHGKPDGSFGISEQFILDCDNNGGCNGDWPSTVFEVASSKGIPTVADYGPYKARPGSCRSTAGMKMFKVADFGYVGQSEGIPSAQAIKDAIVKFGPLAVAVAADNAFMNYNGGVFSGRSNGINHAVILVGWDDAKGKAGAWIMRNSWGQGWGEKGYMWIEYGANSIGYGAMWCSSTPLPPPPDPNPPGPTPPPPGAMTITLSHDMKAGTYPIGGSAITKDTTLRQLLEMLRAEEPKAPCKVGELEKRIAELEKIIADMKAKEASKEPPTLPKKLSLWNELTPKQQSDWWNRHLPNIRRTDVRIDQWFNENYTLYETKP